MQSITRISIPMSPEEKDALRMDAQSHFRDPRSHARYLLRQVLGIADDPRTEPSSNAKNDAGPIRQDSTNAILT